jgi:hypothetical protein
MKQLLTYISPSLRFNAEHAMLARIQIDNSLSLGWQPDHIIVVTNFPYRYRDVEARIVPSDLYCGACWPATKVRVIDYLFNVGLDPTDLWWYHDFDCFQLHPFDEPVLTSGDIGMTNYGRVARLCSASMFFRPNWSAANIFAALKAEVERTGCNEEVSMAWLLRDPAIKARFELLNCTYALNRANIRPNYGAAHKPLKAAHFHLSPDKWRQFVEGKTVLGFPLVPQRLIDIFAAAGWTGQQVHEDE